MKKLFLVVALVAVCGSAYGADKRVTDLTAQTEAIASGDLLMSVDVSDTTDHATGSSKKATYTQVGTYMATLFAPVGKVVSSAACSGDDLVITFADDTTATATDACAVDGTGTDDQTASEVVFTPNGSIAATDVQAAIQEVRDEAGSGHTEVTLSSDLGNNLLGLSTQTISLDNQNANIVFTGPATGEAAAPTFRSLVDADIPSAIARDSELHSAATVGSTANGLSISGQELSLAAASASTPGAATAAQITELERVGAAVATGTDGTRGMKATENTIDYSAEEAGYFVYTSKSGVPHYYGGNTDYTLLVSGGAIGAATATTPSANDNDTSVATTAYVQTEIGATASDSETLTNKTLNTASTGNDITVPLNGLLDFAITAPADDDDLIFKKVQNALTLTDIHCLAEGGGTITVTYQECTTAGASCANIEGAITADSDGAEDDGTLTDGAIAAGAWIKILFSAPSSTVTNVVCTVYGTQTW